jgi:hypothetical protein
MTFPKVYESWLSRCRILMVTVFIFCILSMAITSQTASAQKTTAITSNVMTNSSQISNNDKSVSPPNLGKCDEDTLSFNRALQINPNDGLALDAKGSCLNYFARYIEAVQYFNRALQINPNDAYALKNKNVVISHIASLPLPHNTSSIQPQQQKEVITTKNRTSNPAVPSPQPQQQQPTPPSFQLQPQQQQQQPTPPSFQLQPQQQQQQQQPTPPSFQLQPRQPISQIPGFVSKSGLQPNSTTPTVGFAANGTIDSVLYIPNVRWIATGNWSMAADNGTLAYFTVNMVWHNNNGTATHTHELQNFQPRGEIITVRPNNNVLLKGVVDVGTNHRIKWKSVPVSIEINGGKAITITLNDTYTNHHFGGQSIFGVANFFMPCSEQPGPDMEVLPNCNFASLIRTNETSSSTNNNILPFMISSNSTK